MSDLLRRRTESDGFKSINFQVAQTLSIFTSNRRETSCLYLFISYSLLFFLIIFFYFRRENNKKKFLKTIISLKRY